MNRKVYAISMLLSFSVVCGHMMVPHHHHESLELEYSNPQSHKSNHSHTHDGKHHHSHDEEESENQPTEHSDQNFPQHFHLSASDDVDFARINNSWNLNYRHDNQDLISAELFFKKIFEPPNISDNAYADFEIPPGTQYDPEANRLRGPPTIV
jgi:hypothetical protein